MAPGPKPRRECHELCVWRPAHAGFSQPHALKRVSNMMASWFLAAIHSRTFLPSFSKLRTARWISLVTVSSVGNEPRVLIVLRNEEDRKTVRGTVSPTNAVEAFDGIRRGDDLPDRRIVGSPERRRRTERPPPRPGLPAPARWRGISRPSRPRRHAASRRRSRRSGPRGPGAGRRRRPCGPSSCRSSASGAPDG
jgi:hypothetical protein